MSDQQSRRDFLRNAALTGMGVWIGTSARAQDNPKSANDKLNIACIGVGGKGWSDSENASHFGNIVAICDVDENALNSKAAQNIDGATPFANAKKFVDYRKMFDAVGKQIDVVTVSIPDHSHAPATFLALHMGKAAYTQKPLAHSIYECRQLGNLARKMKVATQMGNQGTAENSLRLNAYKVRAGALGTVKEVHVWTNRPIWPQGIERPAPSPVPSSLHWDLWLGPAPKRPYAEHAYHTFAWRGWWDFGTGALGDMACHTVNLPYMALDLRNPTSVNATSSGTNHDSYPKSSKIVYEFPETTIDGKVRPALIMTWYDGGNLPPKDLLPQDLLPDNGNVPESGSLIIGDKGKLYTPGDYGTDGHIIEGVDVGEVSYPQSPGGGEMGHWQEFVAAIRGGKPSMSNFPDYAGGLAESILLGNLAVWAEGEKVEWDAQNLKVKNGRATADKVAHIIHPIYQPGYHI